MSTITVDAEGEIDALDALMRKMNSGFFVLQAAGATALATLTFAASAFASATTSGSNATTSSNTISPAGTSSGTISLGKFQNSGAKNIISFSISTSASDMNLTSIVIPTGTTQVSCSGVTVTLAIT